MPCGVSGASGIRLIFYSDAICAHSELQPDAGMSFRSVRVTLMRVAVTISARRNAGMPSPASTPAGMS